VTLGEVPLARIGFGDERRKLPFHPPGGAEFTCTVTIVRTLPKKGLRSCQDFQASRRRRRRGVSSGKTRVLAACERPVALAPRPPVGNQSDMARRSGNGGAPTLVDAIRRRARCSSINRPESPRREVELCEFFGICRRATQLDGPRAASAVRFSAFLAPKACPAWGWGAILS
jgi:hypothetical protein